MNTINGFLRHHNRLLLLLTVSCMFSYSSVKAQPCLIPILNNTIDIDAALCANTVATLQGSTPLGGTGSFTYQWQKSVGNCGSSNFQDIPGATTKDYAVPQGTDVNDCFRRVVTSGTCVSQSNSTRVNNQDRTTPAAPSTTTLGSACTSGTGRITVTSPAPGAGIFYSIDGSTYTNTTGVFNNLIPGNYSVTAKYPTGCVSPIKSETILPLVAVTGTITPATATICVGSSRSLTVTGGTSGTSYQWYRNGTIITGATTATYNATLAGTYTADIINGVCRGTASNSSVITVTPLPSGNITPATATVCTGGSVTLTATGGTSYQWYKDDIIINGATAATYSATQAGTYSVNIKSGNCSADGSNVAVITQGISPSGFITPASASLCPGKTITLTAVTAGGGISYQWFLNGTIIPGATAAVYNATQTGNYSVLLSNSVCSASSLNVTTISSSTSINFTTNAANPNCTVTTGTITVSGVTGGGSTNYSYSKDNGTNFQTSNVFASLTPGTYQVVVRDTAGCISSARSVTVQSFASTLSATVTKTDAKCGLPNGSINVQATGGTPAYTYKLDNGTFQASTSFINVSIGNHILTVKDAPGCLVDVPFTIGQSVTVPNLVINNPPQICNGTTANLQAASITNGSDAGLTYTYWQDTTATTTLANPASVGTGIYFIKATNTGGCATIKPVIVVLHISTPGSVSYTLPSSLCDGESITLTASNGTAYQWFKDGSAISGATSASYSASASGTYSVFINDGTCSVKARDSVRLQFLNCLPKVAVPTAFMPNNNGVNDVLRPILSNIAELRFFRVYNRWGKEVYQTNVIGQGWNGTLKGVLQPSEPYMWVVECVDRSGNIIKQSGRSMLIR